MITHATSEKFEELDCAHVIEITLLSLFMYPPGFLCDTRTIKNLKRLMCGYHRARANALGSEGGETAGLARAWRQW